MLDQIQKVITTRYKLDDTKGVFLSVFDKKWNLLSSQGVLHTDKDLKSVTEKLYKGFAEDTIKNTGLMTIDIVTSLFEETNISKIPEASVRQYGFYVIDSNNKSGVILPNTKGVADAKNALYVIKQKYGITWKVKIFLFTTDRLIVTPEDLKK